MVELETRCIEHVEPKRAFEANFHLENSKGMQVLCVEWKGWKVGWEASGQAGGPSGSPQSHRASSALSIPHQGYRPSSMGSPLF